VALLAVGVTVVGWSATVGLGKRRGGANEGNEADVNAQRGTGKQTGKHARRASGGDAGFRTVARTHATMADALERVAEGRTRKLG
jgi:hypothetical protein